MSDDAPLLYGVDIMIFVVFAIAVFLIAADQLLKLLVTNTVMTDGPVSFLNGLVSFQYVENRGVAFGLMQNMQWVFIILTSVLMLAIIVYMLAKKPKSKLVLISFALILGGGIGNLIDRIFLGYVIDYIKLSFFPPVCNFADYAITIGTVLLLIYVLFVSDIFSDKKKVDKEKA